MANCQLAELIKARGPNTQINAACAGTTQAVSIAQDWIRCGRAKRVIVISADTASSDLLLPFLGTGFMALGAASLAPQVSGAAIPFDKRRNGMIMGAGAVGIILEGQANSSSTSVLSRCPSPLSAGGSSVEVVDSHVANSAFHACLMDKTHIPQQLELFLQRLENVHGISRSTLASQLIYMAHETGTHSGGGCAKVELDAVAKCFGENYSQVLIANTKGFTGHPMGVAFEDAIAVYALRHNEITPLPNYSQCDEALPKGTNLSLKGGKHDRSYVLRFAAGFGSQMVYVLYRKVH
jgi:3-oxoacyl-(acyl-carrier-protein) synthase